MMLRQVPLHFQGNKQLLCINDERLGKINKSSDFSHVPSPSTHQVVTHVSVARLTEKSIFVAFRSVIQPHKFCKETMFADLLFTHKQCKGLQRRGILDHHFGPKWSYLTCNLKCLAKNWSNIIHL